MAIVVLTVSLATTCYVFMRRAAGPASVHAGALVVWLIVRKNRKSPPPLPPRPVQ